MKQRIIDIIMYPIFIIGNTLFLFGLLTVYSVWLSRFGKQRADTYLYVIKEAISKLK